MLPEKPAGCGPPHRRVTPPYRSTTSQVLYDWSGAVVGIATGDSGVGRDGKRIEGLYAPGVELRARATLLAEGCRGSLSEVGRGRSEGGGKKAWGMQLLRLPWCRRCTGITIIPAHPAHLVRGPPSPWLLAVQSSPAPPPKPL